VSVVWVVYLSPREERGLSTVIGYLNIQVNDRRKFSVVLLLQHNPVKDVIDRIAVITIGTGKTYITIIQAGLLDGDAVFRQAGYVNGHILQHLAGNKDLFCALKLHRGLIIVKIICLPRSRKHHQHHQGGK